MLVDHAFNCSTFIGVFLVHPLHLPVEKVQLSEVKFLVFDTDCLFCVGFSSAPVFATASVKFATKD